MVSNRSPDTDSTDSTEAERPTYTLVDPRCPVCGNTRFSSTEERIPGSHDSHRVTVTCANCKTTLTIEYRAIDVSWFDSHNELHSGVSHGLLTPRQTEYGEPEMYAPLPNTAVLTQLDWPRQCEDCTEPLTANNMVTDPEATTQTDSDDTDPPPVLFYCPYCDHHTTGTAAESASKQ